jgi:hypothetical protein
MAAALIAPTGAVAADGGAATTIRLHGIVPTICRAQFSNAQATPNGSTVDLGTLSELCNNLGGYRVVLSHAAGLENGTITVDGRTFPLGVSGYTVITDATGPAVVQRSVSIDFGADAPMTLGVRIEPKGAIY